jgi:hypothetical protein
MNALLEAPSNQAETVGLRHDDDGVARKTCRISLNQGSPVLRWLEATAQTIDFELDDLERTHWKKVWRSMLD